MGHPTAIAAVTLTLRDLLQARLGSDGPDPTVGDVLVTCLPPDRARTVHHRPQVNLSLIAATPNTQLRGTVGLAPRAADQAGTAPVDLLYLLTTYGPEDDELAAQRLQGVVLATLHAQPVLPPIDLSTTLPDAGGPGVLTQVRVTPVPLTREQLVSWWLAFHTPYRLSLALQVSGLDVSDGTATT